MNIHMIIGIVAAVAVIGGGAWYVSKNPMEAAPVTAETAAPTEAGTGTIATLLALSGSQTCNVVVTNEEAPATGVVYVSDGKVRADVSAKPSALKGATITAHMIQTDGYLYSWSDMIPKGVKVAVSATASVAASQGFDVNAQVTYDCAPWSADESKFVVPSNVSFMELNGAGAVTR